MRRVAGLEKKLRYHLLLFAEKDAEVQSGEGTYGKLVAESRPEPMSPEFYKMYFPHIGQNDLGQLHLFTCQAL